MRHTIDHTRGRLAHLHQSLLSYVAPFELPEPDEEEVAETRAIAARAG